MRLQNFFLNPRKGASYKESMRCGIIEWDIVSREFNKSARSRASFFIVKVVWQDKQISPKYLVACHSASHRQSVLLYSFAIYIPRIHPSRLPKQWDPNVIYDSHVTATSTRRRVLWPSTLVIEPAKHSTHCRVACCGSTMLDEVNKVSPESVRRKGDAQFKLQ